MKNKFHLFRETAIKRICILCLSSEGEESESAKGIASDIKLRCHARGSRFASSSNVRREFTAEALDKWLFPP